MKNTSTQNRSLNYRCMFTFSALKSFDPLVGKLSSMFFSSNETDRGISDIFNGLELGSKPAIFIKAPAFLFNLPKKFKMLLIFF